MSDSKKLTKKNKNAGRPTKYGDDVVNKLTSVLRMGGTVEQACSYAMISRETYYKWLETKKGFSDKIQQAQHYLDIAAKNVVGQKIIQERDDYNARWYLEKREFRNEPTQTNVQVNIDNQQIDTEEMQEFINWRRSKRRQTLEGNDKEDNNKE